jgi:hypothetical protein
MIRAFGYFLIFISVFLSCGHRHQAGQDETIASEDSKIIQNAIRKQSGKPVSGLVYLLGDGMCSACFEADLELLTPFSQSSRLLFLVFTNNKRSILSILNGYGFNNDHIFFTDLSLSRITLPAVAILKSGEVIEIIQIVDCSRLELMAILENELY